MRGVLLAPMNYAELTTEQLKTQLRNLLNDEPIDVERIKSINAELACRPDESETQNAWIRFVNSMEH